MEHQADSTSGVGVVVLLHLPGVDDCLVVPLIPGVEERLISLVAISDSTTVDVGLASILLLLKEEEEEEVSELEILLFGKSEFAEFSTGVLEPAASVVIVDIKKSLLLV